MTPKAKRLTAKEIIKILLKNGFEEVSQTGSHIKFFNVETRSSSTSSVRTTETHRFKTD